MFPIDHIISQRLTDSHLVKVEVAPEYFVGPLAGQDHLDSCGPDLSGHEVHGGGRAHCGDVKRLDVVDDVGESVDALLDSELVAVVDAADELGHVLCGLQIRRASRTSMGDKQQSHCLVQGSICGMGNMHNAIYGPTTALLFVQNKLYNLHVSHCSGFFPGISWIVIC